MFNAPTGSNLRDLHLRGTLHVEPRCATRDLQRFSTNLSVSLGSISLLGTLWHPLQTPVGPGWWYNGFSWPSNGLRTRAKNRPTLTHIRRCHCVVADPPMSPHVRALTQSALPAHCRPQTTISEGVPSRPNTRPGGRAQRLWGDREAKQRMICSTEEARQWCVFVFVCARTTPRPASRAIFREISR